MTPSTLEQTMKEEHETWVSGNRLSRDEQRYVLELFPESRALRGLSEREWLGQTEFKLKKDGKLDLRSRYCRIAPGRYHRAPRDQPLPPPPSRQKG